ncbi:MAG TPA: ribosome biogenesis GTP-binding protein YihA/YsxC [Euzebya sp.]|nr:ribosome biogenesis GTP-binding protein YihA/YsxC [Euzebya sp.]
MAAPLLMTFRMSVDDPDAMPPSPAEVAVIGRSNVGKSSLVNSLARTRELARTSKTPGRTQLLNVFDIDRRKGMPGTLVDLPGYGYAKAPKKHRETWQARMERYLLDREPLVMVMALVDGEVGPTRLDVATVQWMRFHDIPFTVVATKHDKVRSSARNRRRADLAAGVGLLPEDIVWVSAEKNTGIDRLRTLILDWLQTDPAGRSGPAGAATAG